MTYYNAVFSPKQYQSVTDKAAKYYLESAKSAPIPLIIADIPDAKQYVHVKFAEATGTTGGLEWTEHGQKMNVRHDKEVFMIPRYQGLIQIHNKDIQNFGSQFLGDVHEAEVQELVKTIDDGMFHGPKSEQGIQMQEGFIGQLTSIQDKTSAGGHDCSTKGEIWHVIKELIEDIPYAMREEGPDIVMWINEKTIAEAQAPDRIYQDMVEWDFIYNQFIGPKAVHGRKIGQVIITNKINAEASDDTDGNSADSVDVLGTDGRILMCVPDKRWIARVVSRGFSLIGEERHMLSVDQLYGYRGRVCVFNGDACNYTEALSF